MQVAAVVGDEEEAPSIQPECPEKTGSVPCVEWSGLKHRKRGQCAIFVRTGVMKIVLMKTMLVMYASSAMESNTETLLLLI